jgi:subtilase family serine protease
MSRRYALAAFAFATLVIALLLSTPYISQALADQGTARALITQRIDETRMVTLEGNTRSEANPLNDRGVVSDELQLDHMYLQLRRPVEREAALDKYIDSLTDPHSPNFHQWLTAKTLGEHYGVSDSDITTITTWLTSHGFAVNQVFDNKVMIDFSGTAGRLRETFKTEMHNLEVEGESHVANMSDPKVPAALAPAIIGIVSLNDFKPQMMFHRKADYTIGGGTFAVVPADLATIYNLNPLFTGAISGQGQTVTVIEDTNVFSTGDWTTFRNTFGLNSFTGATFTQVHPSGTNACTNPGVNGAESEAILDAEYASAAAPSANIQLASCNDTSTTFGGLIAVENLVNEATPPAIMSVSYGVCEAESGAALNAGFNSAYQQAASEGVSVFVAAGDQAASTCDRGATHATHGVGITGWGETPYNVAVGGTDFSDTFSGTTSTYWNSTNTSTFGSAKSYIPETPWNDSCGSQILSTFEGFAVPYGTAGFCNSSLGKAEFLDTTAGGGGPSGCATGKPSTVGVVSGTCAGYAKPSWQVVLGNPADGVRDIPDVSLFAANGLWGHYYPFCDSDPSDGGTCSGAPSGWLGAGGTSFASPIMAGIQALINQKTGSIQGNPNPTLYSLAATEFGSTGNASCNSSLGNAVGSSCVFYDITLGDIVDNCTGAHNCFLDGATNGILSTSNTSAQLAYGTTTGWDFASGLGSVNATNLVNAWPTGSTPSFSLTASPSSYTVTQGSSSTSGTITVVPKNGFNSNVTLAASGLPTGVTASFSPDPTGTSSTLFFIASSTATTGTVTVMINGTSGSLTANTTVSLTVNPSTSANFSLSASPNTLSVAPGGTGRSTITITPTGGFTGTVSFVASGLPTGVTAVFSPKTSTTNTHLSLKVASTATAGTSTIMVTGTSGALVNTTTISLTITGGTGGGSFTLSAKPLTLTVTQGGTSGASTITVTPSGGFSGNVTLSASNLPSGVTALFSPNPTATTSTLTFTASSTATTGRATITITGTSGATTATAKVSLTVNP